MPARGVQEFTLEREAKGDYEIFIKNVVKAFIKNFSYGIDCRISPINKKKSWMINEKKLIRVRNILTKSLQEEIKKEDLRTIESETNKTIKELQEIIANAKSDLKYIDGECEKRLEEEL